MNRFPLPLGNDWKTWGRQLTAGLGNALDNLRWKTSEDRPAINGTVLWDEGKKAVVVAIDGKWVDIMSGKKSAFGDSLSVHLTPQVALSAVYGARDNTETFEASGGTVTTSNGDFVLQTGTSVGGYAVLWSRRPLVYQPGIGAECRITGRFTTGVANSLQAVGMFSSINGMFAGYDGASFGFMHRHSGEIEIRKLTITTPSNTSATATVTLNGTGYTASVTNTTAAGNAEEIASGLRAGAAAGAWNIQAVGDDVIFQYKGSGAQSGTYSLSASTGPLAGTIVQDHAGVAQTEDWTTQANWNVDKCDWLDPTKGNIYKFEYAYLGYGPLKFSIFNPTDRDFTLAHVVDWPNANTAPNFNNPSMRPGWIAASLGSTTALTTAGASALGAKQGPSLPGRPFGRSGTQSGVTTEVPVLSIQSRYEFNLRAANSVVKLSSVSIATDSTKGAIFRLYRNATLGGTPQWSYEDEDESIVLYDSSAASATGGRLLGTFNIGPNGYETEDLSDLDIELIAGDTFTVTAERVSGASTEMTASLVWEEVI